MLPTITTRISPLILGNSTLQTLTDHLQHSKNAKENTTKRIVPQITQEDILPTSSTAEEDAARRRKEDAAIQRATRLDKTNYITIFLNS